MESSHLKIVQVSCEIFNRHHLKHGQAPLGEVGREHRANQRRGRAVPEGEPPLPVSRSTPPAWLVVAAVAVVATATASPAAASYVSRGTTCAVSAFGVSISKGIAAAASTAAFFFFEVGLEYISCWVPRFISFFFFGLIWSRAFGQAYLLRAAAYHE